MTALYQNKTIRDFEIQLFSQEGVSDWALMLRAGEGAFHALRQIWPNIKQLLVICGKGNNAGDGFIIASLAKSAGLAVTVLTLSSESDYQGCAAKALMLCKKNQVSIQPFSSTYSVDEADLIVDALLGTGLSGDVKNGFEQAIDWINAAECPVFSVDIPSGLDADTGSIFGCAVEAQATQTMIGLKPGLYTNKGPAYAGKVSLDTLSLSETQMSALKPDAQLLDDSLMMLLTKRPRDAHKGHFGHVLVIGGDYGMGGAVRMTAEAALRVGAGLVTVATRPEHVAVVSGARPEIMCHHVLQSEDLLPLIEKASVIVIGPGLGTGAWSQLLLDLVLDYDKPIVADADCLNLLSERDIKRNNWILTPHPGEAARLLQTSVASLQCDRFKTTCDLTQKYGGVAVLKGVGTVICQANMLPTICPAGNPGMSTGGMGDVLSGVIGGLLGQGVGLYEAAKLGVYLHAKAADMAAENGGERGLLPTDLMKYLRDLVNLN